MTKVLSTQLFDSVIAGAGCLTFVRRPSAKDRLPHDPENVESSMQSVKARRRRRLRVSSAVLVPTSRPALHVDHDLAEHLTLFQIFVRRAQFFQRKAAIHHRLQAPGKNMAENFVQFGHCPHV